MSSFFGLNEFNELVHVSEVARGLACQCRCVGCEEPLVARQGQVRDHHFAHASNFEACESNFESLLHRYAKQLIAQAGGLLVPTTPQVRAFMGWDEDDTERLLLAQGDVLAEVSLGGIRPDLLLTTCDGVQVAIEIAYSSFCDADKIRQFEELGLPVIEIDLSTFKPEGFEPEAVRRAVVQATDRKKWLRPDGGRPSNMPSNVKPPEPLLPATPAPVAAPVQPRHLPEEIINFGGRWVAVKRFPSGDIAVKVVSWDPDLVSLVRTIAKAHGGRFNGRYKTWNVPRWAARLVRNELAEKSRTLRIGIDRPGSGTGSI